MEITTAEDKKGTRVLLKLSPQELGFLTTPTGLLVSVAQCEPDGDRLKIATTYEESVAEFPLDLANAFLRYPAGNPVEIRLQQEIRDLISR